MLPEWAYGHGSDSNHRVKAPRRKPPPLRRRTARVLAAAAALSLAGATTASASVYWTNTFTNSIGRSAIDGSGINTSFITGASTPLAIAVDANRIYWTNYGDHWIGSAPRSGTPANQNFIDSYSAGSYSPAHPMSVVAADGVYWGGRYDALNFFIGRAALDGTSRNAGFVAPMPGSQMPYGLATDGTRLYWASQSTNAIGSVGLDGTGFQTLISQGGLGPQGIAVDDTYIYWTSSTGNIGRARKDGSGVNTTFISQANFQPYGIAVTPQHLYWAEGGPNRIVRSNLDGSGIDRTFVTGLSGPRGVAVDVFPLTAQKSGTGQGTVTSNISGIDCGATCTARFEGGLTVQLTAAPASGSSFTGWAGACAGSATTCNVTLDAAASATATFTADPPAPTPSDASGSSTATPRLTSTVLPQRRRLVSGQSMKVGIRATNAGTATASSVTSCMRLPADLLVTAKGAARRSGRTLCFTTANLAAGASATGVVTVRAAATTTTVGSITGSATGTGLTTVTAAARAITVTARAARARVTG